MKQLCSKRNSGFTIIELMIVLVIIAILVGLAYPSYVDYVRKSKRGEAQHDHQLDDGEPRIPFTA